MFPPAADIRDDYYPTETSLLHPDSTFICVKFQLKTTDNKIKLSLLSTHKKRAGKQEVAEVLSFQRLNLRDTESWSGRRAATSWWSSAPETLKKQLHSSDRTEQATGRGAVRQDTSMETSRDTGRGQTTATDGSTGSGERSDGSPAAGWLIRYDWTEKVTNRFIILFIILERRV